MSIILVRHGETLLNVARTLQPPDTPLSPTGRAQADAVARRLAELGVGAIVSSDMPRARATAEAISQATGLPVAETPLLQERNFGDLRGQSYDTLGFNPLTMTDAPPNGESAEVFFQRVGRAFDDAVQRQRGLPKPLVVVTHGLVIHAMLQRHLQLAAMHTMPARLGNTSVTVFSPEAPHLVDVLDCTAHLAGADRDKAGSLSGG
ncbi:MAG: histidine phosphatase family protein [Rhizobacter sp.]